MSNLPGAASQELQRAPAPGLAAPTLAPAVARGSLPGPRPKGPRASARTATFPIPDQPQAVAFPTTRPWSAACAGRARAGSEAHSAAPSPSLLLVLPPRLRRAAVANELTRHKGPCKQDPPVAPGPPSADRGQACPHAQGLPTPRVPSRHTGSGICLIHVCHFPFLHQVPEDPASATNQTQSGRAGSSGVPSGGLCPSNNPIWGNAFANRHMKTNLPHLRTALLP